MKYVKSFGGFLYDFVIGDDYKIAVAVLLAVVLTAGIAVVHPHGDLVTAVGGVLVLLGFTGSLALDVRASG